MIFNPKVTFTKVSFRREQTEGAYISEGDRYSINAGKIDSFSSGLLFLDNGETVLVEEDWDQIDNILKKKLAEEEAYQAMLRDIQRLGVEPPQEEVP